MNAAPLPLHARVRLRTDVPLIPDVLSEAKVERCKGQVGTVTDAIESAAYGTTLYRVRFEDDTLWVGAEVLVMDGDGE